MMKATDLRDRNDAPASWSLCLASMGAVVVEGLSPRRPAVSRVFGSIVRSIGIELYGPLPGGVAVGGRFAPDAVKVRGLRELDMETARCS